MTISKIKIGASIFLLLAFVLPMMAQTDQAKISPKDKNPVKKELREYKEAYIQPVILEKRLAFETQLSSEDRATIADLQQQKKAFNKAHRQGKKDKHQFGPTEESKKKAQKQEAKSQNRSRAMHPAHRQQRAKFFRENPHAFSTAEALVQKYDQELDAIDQELAPQREQWTQDIKAIRKKLADQKSADQMDKKRGHKKENQEGKKADKELYKRIGFLMMSTQEKD